MNTITHSDEIKFQNDLYEYKLKLRDQVLKNTKIKGWNIVMLSFLSISSLGLIPSLQWFVYYPDMKGLSFKEKSKYITLVTTRPDLFH